MYTGQRAKTENSCQTFRTGLWLKLIIWAHLDVGLKDRGVFKQRVNADAQHNKTIAFWEK